MKRTIRLTERELKKMISESIRKTLMSEGVNDYDEEDFNEFVSQFDNETGESFNVEQHHFDEHGFEKILDETGLTKEEAWEIFKNAAIKAYQTDFETVSPYQNKIDYICFPVVSTHISTIYGDKTVRFPNGDIREIAMNINYIKREGMNVSWSDLCKKFLNWAKESFFSGKYEYTSY